MKMKPLGVLISSLLIVSCGRPPAERTTAQDMATIIRTVDDLAIPIDAKLLTEQFPEAVEGDFIVNFAGTGIDNTGLLNKGYRASLVGNKEKPVAIIFYNPPSEYYLVPFKNVTRLERPRNLTRLGDRFYRIESNRSGKGVKGTEL